MSTTRTPRRGSTAMIIGPDPTLTEGHASMTDPDDVTTPNDDDDPWLYGPQAAEEMGMSPAWWRSAGRAEYGDKYRPYPDDPGDLRLPANRRNARWRLSTVRNFQRAGQGTRTDLYQTCPEPECTFTGTPAELVEHMAAEGHGGERLS